MIECDPVTWFADRAHRSTPKRLKRVTPVAAAPNAASQQGNPYRFTRSGYRADIDTVTRSRWEADVLRIMKSYNIKCEYEPYVFLFPIKRGTKSYTPDIFIPSTGDYIEIKGYFDDTSRIKLKRWAKYYPEEFSLLTMIISRNSKRAKTVCETLNVPAVMFYEDITKAFSSKISNWE